MIDSNHISAHRTARGWANDYFAEHDLLMVRLMLRLGSDARTKDLAVVSGGTAIHFVHANSPGRFSEDIDLVSPTTRHQIRTLMAARRVLKDYCREQSLVFAWKHYPSRYFGIKGRYVDSQWERRALKVETSPSQPHMANRAEIIEVVQDTNWHRGRGLVKVVPAKYIAATKLLALNTRAKGRDLFDAQFVINDLGYSIEEVADAFSVLKIGSWSTDNMRKTVAHNLTSSSSFRRDFGLVGLNDWADTSDNLTEAVALVNELGEKAEQAHPLRR